MLYIRVLNINDLFLLEVAVAKDLQRKNIGKSMMLDAEKWTFKKGFNCVHLDSLSHTKDFYKKCGYSEDNDFKGWMKKQI